MKRVVKVFTVSNFFEYEEIRKLHGPNYFNYRKNKDKIDESYFNLYQSYIDKIFCNDALDFIHMICVSGYKQDELISFEVTLNQDYLIALHWFLNNLMPYKGKLLKEWTEESRQNESVKKILHQFWKYELYFQCYFEEE